MAILRLKTNLHKRALKNHNVVTQQVEKPQPEPEPAKKTKLTPKQIYQYINLLKKRYPRTFNLKAPKPLKRKIHLDIHSDLKTVDIPAYQEIKSHKPLHRILKYYCRRPEYLRTVIAVDAFRIDLKGQTTEQKVSDKEREYAQELLEKLKKKENTNS